MFVFFTVIYTLFTLGSVPHSFKLSYINAKSGFLPQTSKRFGQCVKLSSSRKKESYYFQAVILPTRQQTGLLHMDVRTQIERAHTHTERNEERKKREKRDRRARTARNKEGKTGNKADVEDWKQFDGCACGRLVSRATAVGS